MAKYKDNILRSSHALCNWALTVQDAESATHVVIGEKHEALETSSLPKKARVVTSEWLEDCLSKQRRLPEREYAADPEELAKEADSEHLPPK